MSEPGLPGTTRARYALLIGVPVVAAIFAGNQLYFQLDDGWLTAAQACQARTEGTQPLGRAFALCLAPAERLRVGWSVGAGLVTVLVGAGLLRLLPARMYRRLGRVRSAGERRQLVAAEAVRSMGGRAVPLVEFASAAREAFTVRVRGRTRIVLPNGVLALPAAEANALLRHECAHVVAGDVGRVWLTRGVWWATPAILALPPVVDLALGLLSEDDGVARHLWTSFHRDYAVRSVLLMALVWLVSRGVLRSREHEADLLSTRRVEDRAALAALLGRGRDAAVSRVRELTALHPSFARRLAVLDDRGRGGHARGVEGFAFGALAGNVLLVGSYYLRPLFQGIEDPVLSAALADAAVASLPGVLLGYAWGATVWQAAGVDDGRPWRSRLVDALGLPLGALLGLALALTGDGVPWQEDSAVWWWVVLPIALVGTAGLCAGAAAVHRQRGGPVPRWTGPLIAVLFIGAISPVQANAALLAVLGWEVFLENVLLVPAWVPLAGQAAVAAGIWWWGRGVRLRLLTVTAVAVALVAGPRLWLVEPATLANVVAQQRVDVLLAATTGLAVAVLLVLVRGRVGLGLGAAASWVTTAAIAVVLPLRFNHPGEVLHHYLVPSLSFLAAGLFVVAAATVLVRDR
ncbi:MAG TPA: M48 family metalloprotease, partial [Umezawaea sp.]|nr:M48 family metalloprotease [Umezawaea sp.]